MIEIPESYTLAKQINETIVGKKITKVLAGASPHKFAFFYENAPEAYHALLLGQTIKKAEAIAGYVKIETDNADILFQDGVNLRYFGAGEEIPAKNQLYVEFADVSGFTCTVQMYGAITACPKDAFKNDYYSVAKAKPPVLSDDFSYEYFKEMYYATSEKDSVKAFLATKQRIPGLGNGCLQDILLNAELNPKTKLSETNENDLLKLYSAIKNTIKLMCEHGARDTEKDFFGNAGGYKTMLSSKTYIYPCIKCGGTVVRKAYLGGNVYYCEVCQPI